MIYIILFSKHTNMNIFTKNILTLCILFCQTTIWAQKNSTLILQSETKQDGTYVGIIKERKEDFAWENDRIAFRVYSRLPKGNNTSSGIDVWVKSVSYPIIQKWYEAYTNGISYHIDRGEGCDFYVVGKTRGCGGTAIYNNGKLYAANAYANYRIYKKGGKSIDFRLDYQPFLADQTPIYETKRIKMVNGTNFFQVTSTIESENEEDLLVAIGLANQGKGEVKTRLQDGLLAVNEAIGDKYGVIGTAVWVAPEDIDHFETIGQNEVVILKIHSGVPFTYYVGASWDGDPRYTPFTKWNTLLEKSSYRQIKEWYQCELQK